MEASLKFVENYARTYMYHILAFFGQLKEDADTPPPTLTDGTLLIYSMINAVVVAALQGLFIDELSFQKIDFYQSVIIQVCYWLLLCILLHFILSFRGKDVRFTDSITAILQVVPVAFVIGAYTAFVFYFLAIGYPGIDKAPWIAATAAAMTQFLLMVRYLPPSVGQIEGVSKGRQRAGAYLIIFFVFFVNFVAVVSSWSMKSAAEEAPAQQQAPAQKAQS